MEGNTAGVSLLRSQLPDDFGEHPLRDGAAALPTSGHQKRGTQRLSIASLLRRKGSGWRSSDHTLDLKSTQGYRVVDGRGRADHRSETGMEKCT